MKISSTELFNLGVMKLASCQTSDFFHAVGAGCPALSHFLPHAASRGAWKTSRGKHMSFSTWMPSIRAELIMDRGLYLVLQAGPANARLTRFLFVTPCFCVTPPQRSHCLPKHRHRIPRCDNTMPFASIWLGLGLALTSTIGNCRLTLKICDIINFMFYLLSMRFFIPERNNMSTFLINQKYALVG